MLPLNKVMDAVSRHISGLLCYISITIIFCVLNKRDSVIARQVYSNKHKHFFAILKLCLFGECCIKFVPLISYKLNIPYCFRFFLKAKEVMISRATSLLTTCRYQTVNVLLVAKAMYFVVETTFAFRCRSDVTVATIVATRATNRSAVVSWCLN